MVLFAWSCLPVLARVAETYRSLRSYYFEGKSISGSTIEDNKSRSEVGFVVAFAAPNKFRLEFRYPNAGEWLRVSDGNYLLETRSATKESRRTPSTERTIRVLSGSPVYNFERLSKTAENAMVMRTDWVEVDGKKIEGHLIQFSAGRRPLRKAEWAGPSSVWVSKETGLVVKEEIRTHASHGAVFSESRRTTTIERFRIDRDESQTLFATQ